MLPQQVVETLLSEKPVFIRLPSNELKKLSTLGEETNRETLHYLQAHKWRFTQMFREVNPKAIFQMSIVDTEMGEN